MDKSDIDRVMPEASDACDTEALLPPLARTSVPSASRGTIRVARPQATEHVVRIDDDGFDMGHVEKSHAHRAGIAHRAVSVMLRNRRGAVLLQRRSELKYHCAGLWANTCCGHPRPGETTQDAAERRLWEELGIRCPVYATNVFRYRCPVPDGLVENELVHLYVGLYNGPVRPDPMEVDATEWVDVAELQERHAADAAAFAPWFRLYMDRLPAFVGARFDNGPAWVPT